MSIRDKLKKLSLGEKIVIENEGTPEVLERYEKFYEHERKNPDHTKVVVDADEYATDLADYENPEDISLDDLDDDDLDESEIAPSSEDYEEPKKVVAKNLFESKKIQISESELNETLETVDKFIPY